MPTAQLRASDADRDRVADMLRDALAEGRLTTDEHADRLDALYEAKTLGELEPLTRDLPAHYRTPGPAAAPVNGAPAPGVGRTESTNLLAVFGGASRKGQWRVGSELRVVAVFGGADIDLTEAVFESPEVVITITAIFGGVDVKVPENISVRNGGATGIFGGFDVHGYESGQSGAPVVTVRGAAVFGGVDVKRKRGKRLVEWARGRLER